MKLDAFLVNVNTLAPASSSSASTLATASKTMTKRTLLQCPTDPTLFIDLCLHSDSATGLDVLVTDLASLWLHGSLPHHDLRLACPDHLSLQQFTSLLASNLGLGLDAPSSTAVQDPWHARVVVSEVMDLTDSQVNAPHPPPSYSLDIVDSANTVQLALHLAPIPNPHTPSLLGPILASYASLAHSLRTRTSLSAPRPALPSTPLALASITAAPSSSASAAPAAPPHAKKPTSSSKKSTSAAAAAEKEQDRVRREHEKLAKLAAKEADRAAKEAAREAERAAKDAERAAKDAERAAKLKDKEDAKRERERAAEEKKRKQVQGTARIMDMFVKRVAKPSASASAAGAEGSEHSPVAADARPAERKYFDTLFVDFVPKRTMTVVPFTHFQPTPADNASKSARDIFRSPTRHASHLPMLPPALRPTLVGQPLTDADSTIPRPRFKLLQFAEDLRPAYWGTWRKPSARVTGRRPFARDASGVLDYEYDSEAEWDEEDEGDGEEIRSEDEADDDESVAGDETADMDDGWLLDDDEFARSAGTSVAAAGGRRVVRSLEPVVLGPFWGGGGAKGVDAFAVVWLGDNAAPLDPFAGLDLSVAPSKTNNAHAAATAGTSGGHATTPGAAAARKSNVAAFPEEHILTFIRAVHGNPHGVQKIVEELKARPEFASTPKTQLEAKLKAITVKEKRLTGKLTFYVKDDILRHHRLSPTTLQVEPADPDDADADIDQSAPGTPPAALPRLPFKPLALSAPVKRPATNEPMGDGGKVAAAEAMCSPAKRAKVAGGLPPLPVARVRDENESGAMGKVAEDDEEEIGSDDSDEDDDEEEEYESDTDGDGDGDGRDDMIEIDGGESDTDAFPSPTPLPTLTRRRPSTAVPPPPAHQAPPATNAGDASDDDPMDVDAAADPLLDFFVYDLSTLTGPTTAVSPDTAPLILRQLLLNKDPPAHQSQALAALGTWAATTPASTATDALAASPDLWAILPRCLCTRELRANALRMIQPACAQDPAARDAAVERVAREVAGDVWRAVEAAVGESDALAVNYGLAVVVDMAGVGMEGGEEDEEEAVEDVWGKVRRLVEWAAMPPICGSGAEDLVAHGKRCALAAVYQYLCTLVDCENEAVVARVMERGGAKDECRVKVLALKELEWVKKEEGLARTVDECVAMLSS